MTAESSQPGTDHARQQGNTKSQHADVPIWCDDPCCCEPEPRWQQLAAQQQREAAKRAEPCDADQGSSMT
jgi:hypothetical protein